jgi:hypothetical protein
MELCREEDYPEEESDKPQTMSVNGHVRT